MSKATKQVKTIKTTIVLPLDLYARLLDIQTERRRRGDFDVSLSDIMVSMIERGLEKHGEAK